MNIASRNSHLFSALRREKDSTSSVTLSAVVESLRAERSIAHRDMRVFGKKMETTQTQLHKLEAAIFPAFDDEKEELAFEKQLEKKTVNLQEKFDEAEQNLEEKKLAAGHLSEQLDNLNAICDLVAEKINTYLGKKAVTPLACGEILTVSCIKKSDFIETHLGAALDALIEKHK